MAVLRIEGAQMCDIHIGRKVKYVPTHVGGRVDHPDCELGTITSYNEHVIFVRFKGPTGEACCADDLRWA